MRAVSAKALSVLLLSMLLRLQRDHHPHAITQGVATLYPGLCASVLAARAGQCHITKVEGLRSKVEGLRSNDEGLRSKVFHLLLSIFYVYAFVIAIFPDA